jgi:hypothetical protein
MPDQDAADAARRIAEEAPPLTEQQRARLAAPVAAPEHRQGAA